MPKVGYFNDLIYFLTFFPFTKCCSSHKEAYQVLTFRHAHMRLSKKGWMVLSTLAIIGLGFAFYFLVYVKQKEAEILAEKMRVLTQIRANIGLLIKNEGDVAKTFPVGNLIPHPITVFKHERTVPLGSTTRCHTKSLTPISWAKNSF